MPRTHGITNVNMTPSNLFRSGLSEITGTNFTDLTGAKSINYSGIANSELPKLVLIYMQRDKSFAIFSSDELEELSIYYSYIAAYGIDLAIKFLNQNNIDALHSYLPAFRGLSKRNFEDLKNKMTIGSSLYNYLGVDEYLQEPHYLKDYRNLDSLFQEFNLGEGIEFLFNDNGNSISVKRENNDYSLADIGFGTSQILAVLLTGLDSKSNYSLIEEPESHLHPSLQSKLADFFTSIVDEKFPKKFILETHSEYLIRKFQFLVATKKLKSESVIIYYFDKNTGKPNSVSKIEIQEDGSLSKDFGPGFLDEADNIAIDLFNHKKFMKN
jgi:hypothetical protein